MQSYPTLMRPITLRNYSYNQSVCPGSMLVEVGAAGNSLDGRSTPRGCSRQGLAQTITAVGSAQKRWTSQSVMRAVSPQSGCGRPR